MKKTRFFVLLFLLLAGGDAQAENSRNWPNPSGETIAVVDISGTNYGVQLLEGEHAQSIIESFNKSIKDKKITGNISYCRRVINIPVGTAHGNHSYGGLCVYENPPEEPKKILICNDVLVGHFKMTALKAEEDDVLSLSGFVRDNCFGG